MLAVELATLALELLNIWVLTKSH